MKNKLHKDKHKHTNQYLEYDDNSRHGTKKVRTHRQEKANNALDRVLRQKNLKNIYELDDYY
jgi:hypothetical protein